MSFAENAAKRYCVQVDYAESAVRASVLENGKQNISHAKIAHFGEAGHRIQSIQKLSIINSGCQSAGEIISHVKDAE